MQTHDPLQPRSGPELVFGLVGPVGVDLHQVHEVLASELHGVGYSVSEIRMSELLHQIEKYAHLSERKTESEYERIKTHMEAGQN